MLKHVLYSFRRCPYAIRARYCLHYAKCNVELIEVSLKNKPARLLEISPKGTVPVLQLADGTVIDESLDIMRYALATSDPDHWLPQTDEEKQHIEMLITGNDIDFKKKLDRYKYHIRHPEESQESFREQGEEWINALEIRLSKTAFLVADRPTMADVALFPFIRQWSGVEEGNLSGFPHVLKWLEYFLQSPRFDAIMGKQTPAA